MKTILACAAVLLSAGCVSNKNDLDETFGAAFAANNAAQIIDPTPAEGAPQGDGANADLATIRYKTDSVKQPQSGQFKPGETTAPQQQSGPPPQ